MRTAERPLTHASKRTDAAGRSLAFPAAEVRALVDDIFEKHDAEKNGQLDYAEYMRAVAEHPKLVEFIASAPNDLEEDK